MKMKLNPDKKWVEEVRAALKENDFYCPCKIDKEPDSKCICKDCRETGVCECGLYIKDGD